MADLRKLVLQPSKKLAKQPSKKLTAKVVTAPSEEVQNSSGSTTTMISRSQKHLNMQEDTRKLASARMGPPSNKATALSLDLSKPTQIFSKLNMADLYKLASQSSKKIAKQASKKSKATVVTTPSEEVQNLSDSSATIAKRSQNNLKNSPGESKRTSPCAQQGPPFNKEQMHQLKTILAHIANLN